MKRNPPRAALGVIGIGIASAAGVFALHRASDGPAPATPAASTPAAARQDSPRAAAPANADRVPEGHLDERVADAGRSDAEGELPADRAERFDRAEDDINPHIEALRHPSPTYRNVSLATVIRAAGYECVDVVSSAAGDDELATWRVSCDGAHAYLVSEDGAGGLRVERMAYFDAPTPFIPRSLEDAPSPVPVPVPLPR